MDFVFIDSAAAPLRPAGPPTDLQREPLLSTYFLAFNTERPPLNRPEVRGALARALDREALPRRACCRPTRLPHVLLPPEPPRAAPAEMAERAARTSTASRPARRSRACPAWTGRCGWCTGPGNPPSPRWPSPSASRRS